MSMKAIDASECSVTLFGKLSMTSPPTNDGLPITSSTNDIGTTKDSRLANQRSSLSALRHSRPSRDKYSVEAEDQDKETGDSSAGETGNSSKHRRKTLAWLHRNSVLKKSHSDARYSVTGVNRYHNGSPISRVDPGRASVSNDGRLPHHPGRSQSYRRESFLYRSDVSDGEMSPTFRSGQSSINLRESGSSDEIIVVTPFAQLISCLRTVRNNYMILHNIPSSRSRRESAQTHSCSPPSSGSEEEPEKVVLETLYELEWCLDQLENIQTHKSAAHLAAHKFKRMLSRELSELTETSKDCQMSEYIARTFLESEEHLSNGTQTQNKRTGSKSVGSVVSFGETDNTATSAMSVIRPNGECRENPPSALSSRSAISKYGVPVGNENLLDQSMQRLDTWGLDVFRISELTDGRPLTAITFTITRKMDLLKKFRIPEHKFLNYIAQVESHYKKDNPYHNSLHAADVTQSSYCLLHLPALQNTFTDLEKLATIFASAVHDVDHPGYTNQFLINNHYELALMYNDESVLENHHLAIAFKLLQGNHCDMLQTLSTEQRKSFRHMVIGMVLATDMSKHMNHVAHLKTMAEMCRLNSNGKLSLTNHTDKMQVLQGLIHCADLSNPTKPLELYNLWTERVMKEFFQQGDEEKRLGVEVSPMCDREKSTVFSTQTGFIDFIVHPLWETWAELVHPDCQFVLDNLETNRQAHEAHAAANT